MPALRLLFLALFISVTLPLSSDAAVPIISNVPNQTTGEDAPVTIPFTVTDADTPVFQLVLSATSSNTVLVPAGNIFFDGSGTNRTVTIVPAPEQSGTALITLRVSDGVTNASDTFVLTVNAVNDPPTLNPITNVALVVDFSNKDVFFNGISAGATNENQTLTVTAVSSNTALVTINRVDYEAGATNGSVRLASPSNTGTGTAVVAVTVSDGISSVTRAFTVFVWPKNNVMPTVSAIANQTTAEDTLTPAIAFTVGDSVTPASLLTLSGLSSNTNLVPNANLVFGGSGSNRTLIVTPALNQSGSASITVFVNDTNFGMGSRAFILTVNPVNDPPLISPPANQTIDEDGATGLLPFAVRDVETPAANVTVTASSSNPGLVPNASILLGGTGTNRALAITPLAGQSGSAAITLTASDGVGGTNATNFILTVNAVNDAPAISAIDGQVTSEDTPTGAIPFTVGDVETPAANLVVTGASSDLLLVPLANIVFGGSGANRTVTVTPATNRSGSAIITVTVRDAGGLEAGSSFALTVNAVNDLPLISEIVDQATDEDAPKEVAFTIGDVETPAVSLVVTGASSNLALVPEANITFGGSGANRTVLITPTTNQSGSATITLTVSDGDGGSNATSFVVTVNAVNDAPVVSPIDNQVTDEDTPAGAISFTIGDLETAAGNLLVTARSSNLALVPNTGLVLGGSGTNRHLTVTPATNQSGSAIITVEVRDAGGRAVSSSFALTVNAVNDAPVISTLADLTTVGTAPVSDTFSIADVETAAGSLGLTASSSNPALIPDANIVFSSNGGNRTVTVTAAPDQSGSATLTLTVTDGDGGAASNSFNVTVTPAPPAPPAIASPPQSQTVLAGANVTFSVTVAGTAPLSYQWKFNGSDLAGHTNASLTLVNVQGAHAGGYQVVVTNQAGSISSTPAVLTVASGPAPPVLTLISTGAVWKYLDSGDSPGTGWAQPAFDDAGWASGSAQLGWGDGDEATVMNLGAALKPVTAYLRRTFVVTNSTYFFNYTLRVLCDDGAAIYINGQPVARVRMPEGPLSPSTPATSAVEGAGESEFVQRAAFAVVPGTNVVAVELHQASGGRHDASFDFELLAGLPLTPPSLTLLTPTNRQEQTALSLLLSAAASDLDGHVYAVQFTANGSFIGSDLTPPYELAWEAPAAGRYAIQARAIDNYGYSTYSPVVHVQLGEPSQVNLVRGPYLQSGSSTGLVVRWRTDWFISSVVRYGTNPAALEFAVTNGVAETEHAMALTGLLPDTTYFYEVGTVGLVLSAGEDHQFVTAPTNARPVRFWAIGDFGTGGQKQFDVRDAYSQFLAGTNGTPGRTDLWLMLGDNAYDTGSDDDYQRGVFNAYPGLLRQSVAWPTIGNHEIDSNGETEAFPYLEIFHLPRNGEAGGVASGTERYYSFDYANIHFICLDATTSSRLPGSPMLTWLDQDLMTTDKDWIVAFWHQPPYTFGTHNSDFEGDLIQMRENVLPILDKYGVDLVLCGHSHNYERSYLLDGHYGFANSLTPGMVLDGSLGREPAYHKPAGGMGAHGGAVYVVCGCSGEGGYFNFPKHPAHAVNIGAFGSVVVEVDGLRMDVKFLRETGVIDDFFSIDKSQHDPAMQPMLRVDRAPGALDFSWPTSLFPFQLEARALLDPAAEWLPIPYAPTAVGRSNFLRVELTPTNQFFRLRAAP